MKTTTQKKTNGEDAALQYLARCGALGKLATPCPVLYKDIICWKPKANR